MIGPSSLTKISVSISGERADALLSALRRRDDAEARALLDGWDPLELLDDEPCSVWERKENDLTLWVRDECRLHVAAGRFQFALALLDRYLVLPPVFSLSLPRASAI